MTCFGCIVAHDEMWACIFVVIFHVLVFLMDFKFLVLETLDVIVNFSKFGLYVVKLLLAARKNSSFWRA